MIVQISNFIPTAIAIAASNAIPDENWQWWHRYNNKNSIKYGSTDHFRFPNSCRIALEEIGKKFIPPANSFPDFDYHAGGMHMLPPGGWLAGHYDAEYHPLFSWRRVGSLIWFANQEWEEEWGGHLIVEGEKITPEFNKIVYFDTYKCWHEVTKVTGPEFRKTMALFYWEKVYSIPEGVNKSANFEGMK